MAWGRFNRQVYECLRHLTRRQADYQNAVFQIDEGDLQPMVGCFDGGQYRIQFEETWMHPFHMNLDAAAQFRRNGDWCNARRMLAGCLQIRTRDGWGQRNHLPG